MSGLIGIPPVASATPTTSNPTNDGDLVVDISQNDFQTAVIDASMETPILVDFWAPWCGPCKSLGPLIEKVVNAAGGAVRLVKINTDENQELASQLRIQSLPTVYAFFEGRPIDGFQGALPESEISAFIDKLMETTGATPPNGSADVDAALAKAEELIDANELEQADTLIQDLFTVAGDNEQVIILMAKLMLAQGKKDELSELLANFEPDFLAKPEVKAISAALALSNGADGLAPLEELRATATATPDDQQTQFDLSRSLLAIGKRDDAVDILLGMFKHDRDWQDGAARQKLLELFDVYGPTDSFTIATRRRLSALYYS